jgi:hypothetical protein
MTYPNPDPRNTHKRASRRRLIRSATGFFDYLVIGVDSRRDAPAGRLYRTDVGAPHQWAGRLCQE